VFEFNADDLRSNHHHQLSPRQKEWLKMVARGTRRSSWTSVIVILFFMCLGMSLILALYLQNEDTRAALFSNPINLLMFPVIAVVIVSIIVLSVALAYWNARKLENATLLSVTGAVRFDESYSSKSNIRTYYVYAGKKRFSFGSDMSRNFTEGATYRFYYCKPGMYEFVMSYERMKD
jgi:hypothetical protein